MISAAFRSAPLTRAVSAWSCHAQRSQQYHRHQTHEKDTKACTACYGIMALTSPSRCRAVQRPHKEEYIYDLFNSTLTHIQYTPSSGLKC